MQSVHFLLLLLPPQRDKAQAETTTGRVGITVSSKVGNAVVRNRLKRWMREYARHHKHALPRTDVIFVAKMSAAGVTHPEIDRDLGRLLGRASDVAQ